MGTPPQVYIFLITVYGGLLAGCVHYRLVRRATKVAG